MNILGSIFEWFCRILLAGCWSFLAVLYLVGLVIAEVLMFFSGTKPTFNTKNHIGGGDSSDGKQA